MNKKVLSAITLMPVILAGDNHQGETQSQEQHMSAVSTTLNSRKTALSLQRNRRDRSRTTRGIENDTIDDNRMHTREGAVSTIEATRLTASTVSPGRSQGEDAPAAELPATQEVEGTSHTEAMYGTENKEQAHEKQELAVASVMSQEEDASAEDLIEHPQSEPSAADVKDDSTYKISVQCEDTATDQPEKMREIIEQCVREQLKAIQQSLPKNDPEGSKGPSARSVFLDTVDNLLIDVSSEKVAYSILAKLQEHTTRQDNDTAKEEPTETLPEESYTEEDLSATTTKDDELRQKTSELRAIKAQIAAIEADIEDQNQQLDKTQETLAKKKSELQAKHGELLTIKKKLNKSVSVITAFSDNMKTLQDSVNDTVSQITSAILKHTPAQYLNTYIGESLPMQELVRLYQSTADEQKAIAIKALKAALAHYEAHVSQLFGDKINAKMFALKDAETLKDATDIVSEKNGINEILKKLKDLDISMNDNNQTYDAEEKYMVEIITSLAACKTEISELQQDVEKITKQYEEDQQAAGPDEKEEMLNKIAQDNPDLLVKVLNEHPDVLAQCLEALLKSDNSEREDAQIPLGILCGQIIHLAQIGMEHEKKLHDERSPKVA